MHRGGANTLFCDGHVQWHPQRDLVLPGHADNSDQRRLHYNRVARMWNNTNQPGG